MTYLNEGSASQAVGLLGAANYDPAEKVEKATTSLLAMTALDTTNLRVKFTAPASGNVQVRLKGQTHGATTFPRILLGVLESSTLRGRMSPLGTAQPPQATSQMAQEAVFLVTGLEAGKEYTWDAAYGVEIVLAATALKYGGPNDTAGNDAFGAFAFEVWEAPSLLAGTFYDPAVSVEKDTHTALLAMTAMDTTNLRLAFKAPASGKVRWRVRGQYHGSATTGQLLLGVLESSTVKGRSAPITAPSTTALASACFPLEATGTVTGLTPGTEYTWDAAYAVQVVAGAGGIKYGGPNNTTTNDAFGGLAFEVWTS